MRNKLSLLLALLLCLGAMSAGAEAVVTEETPSPEAQAVLMQGLITEISEGGVLVETSEMGSVLVKLSADTQLEGVEEELAVGQYVIVAYDGMMTRSLPPQITAQKISVFVIHGVVVEVTEDGVLMERYEDKGQVLVRLPEGADPLYKGCVISVYSNGVMTASLPPQVNALYVHAESLQGVVGEVTQESFLLTTEEDTEYQVNFDGNTVLDRQPVTGEAVRVYYDGTATFSIPAQVFAIAVHEMVH